MTQAADCFVPRGGKKKKFSHLLIVILILRYHSEYHFFFHHHRKGFHCKIYLNKDDKESNNHMKRRKCTFPSQRGKIHSKEMFVVFKKKMKN